MKKLLALIVLLASTSATLAVDNTLLITPCASGCITTKSKDIGAGVQAPQPIISDTSGNPIYGTAGTANANVLTVQGIAAMTPIIVNQGTSPWVVNTTQWASGTLGAMANYGTSPGAVLVPGVNSFITNVPAVSQSGTWNVTNVSGTVSLPTGAATAANQGLLTTWAGGTLGAMANYGTSPGAVLVPGVNAFVTNATSPGVATAANSLPSVQALDLVNSTTGNIAANNTTAVVVNAAATTLYSAQLGGIGSAPAYLKLYNATSATCGSGTPVKRLIIPAAATAANGAGSNIVFPLGLRFSTGLTYCVTTGITDADTTAPAASTFLVNLDWR